MNERGVVTFPGPGGSRVSCCIVPCGCIVVIVVGLLLGSIGVIVHARTRAVRTPTAAAAPTSPTAATAMPPSPLAASAAREPAHGARPGEKHLPE